VKYLFLILFLLFISCSKDSFIKEEIVLIEEKQETINNEADIINEQEKINNDKIITPIEKKNRDNEKIIETPKPIETIKKEKSIGTKDYKEPFDEIVKIGVLLPFSGKNKKLGHSISNALEMALFETKSQNIKLIFRDSGENLEMLAKASKDLEKEGVAIIIGPVFSFQAAMIRKKVKINIPIFSFTNDESIKSEGLWTLGFSPKQQIEAIFLEMLNHSITDISIIAPENIYGDIILQESRKMSILKNIQINQIYRYDRKAKDFSKFSKYLNKDNLLRDNGLLIIASGKQLREISSRAQYKGLSPKKIKYFGISGWNDDEILGEPALLGGYFIAPQQHSYETFVSRYFKLYDMIPNEISGLAYDILALLSIGLKDSNNMDELLNFLTNPIGFNGIFGFFKISSHGDVLRKFITYEVMERNFVIKSK
jgi:branched-chain amino acid transport system substrate-binding protein